jgi:nucleotide-binding universal stress UspA family protein
MKKIIVPVDFSDTSKNAAVYAGQIAKALSATITLLNVVEPIAAGSDGTPIIDEYDARKKITELALENLKPLVLDNNPEISVTTIADENNSLIESLRKVVAEEHADLIVMGITGNSLAERLSVGSNTINIVHENICPVIIVPPFARYKEIKKVLFATDFKNVEASTPVPYIKEVLDAFRAELYVVNVDNDSSSELSDEYRLQRGKMEALLAGYQTSYHFINQDDFSEAISQFSADHQIDLILVVPRKHTFLSSLFSFSHTRQLAYHSHVPVITIHE